MQREEDSVMKGCWNSHQNHIHFWRQEKPVIWAIQIKIFKGRLYCYLRRLLRGNRDHCYRGPRKCEATKGGIRGQVKVSYQGEKSHEFLGSSLLSFQHQGNSKLNEYFYCGIKNHHQDCFDYLKVFCVFRVPLLKLMRRVRKGSKGRKTQINIEGLQKRLYMWCETDKPFERNCDPLAQPTLGVCEYNPFERNCDPLAQSTLGVCKF